MQGPAAGSLIITKDGNNYDELCNIRFKYNEIKTAKDFDFKYPTDFELSARKGKEKLHLDFKMSKKPREYIISYPNRRYWLGLAICEAPGAVEGYYFDGNKKIKLKGICKIEPQRQISILGNNKLTIDFLKPPKGIGITFNLHSNFLQKNFFINIQLVPKLNLEFKTKIIHK